MKPDEGVTAKMTLMIIQDRQQTLNRKCICTSFLYGKDIRESYE